ncbi:hypothetical protein BC835DRAFT_1424562 [Cytidiella melzeri]|nr:hypothetical protein BC835DRAFT_1424562 [Cytidiella melzeri]
MSRFAKVEGLGHPELSKKQLASMPTKFQDVPESGQEQEMYAPLCKSLNEAIAQAVTFAASQGASNATAHTTNVAISSAPDAQTTEVAPPTPPYVFKDVSNWIESKEHDLKIDIAMYPDTENARVAFTRNMEKTARTDVARVAWAWMTMGVEVKRDEAESVFDFGRPSLLRDSDTGRRAQAQIAKYATQLMLRQHRAFVFILYIVDKEAFLTRWDRVGCIISTPVKRAWLQYYGRARDFGQGSDVEQEFKNPYAASCAKDILNNQVLYPIYKVICANVAGTDRGVYFIGKHSVALYSPTGRATKGYVTFNKQKPTRLYFMKDYWRPNSRRIPKELDVYKKLKAAGVRYVASVIDGEDLVGQCTVTQIHLVFEEVPLERVHCRLVFEQLAQPLEAYWGSSDMIVVLLNALQGHEEAWTKAGVLHRDISVDNVMRVVDQDDKADANVLGILNDWDLCKYKDELEQPAMQYNRSGTWAFISAVALQYPFKPNELADDLESFIHVATYCSLRFHRHNLTNHTIGRTLNPDDLIKTNCKNGALSQHVWAYFYQSVDHDGGLSTGGEKKLLRNQIGSPGFTFSERHVSPILVDLLRRLYRLLKTHYSTIDFEELKQYQVSLASSLEPPPSQDTKDNSAVPVVRALNYLPNYLEHSDSESDDSEEDDETASEAAPTPLPRGSRALDTHAEIRKVFRKAAEQIRKAWRQGKLVQDVTQDQFLGLAAQGELLNSKRMRLNEDTASYLDGVAEETEGDDSDEDERSVE